MAKLVATEILKVGEDMTEFKSTRTAYGEILLELAREGKEFFGISADTSKSMGIATLATEFPQRCFDVGIAEQNLMMVAAGMVSTGKTVFASTYSAFSSMRACEQIRTFIAYPGLNVKIVSGLGGLSAGIEGVTHIALEDLGIMRCIPDIVIINPADTIATKQAVREAMNHDGPVYIRLGREASPVIFDDSYKLKLGKGVVLDDAGNDIALITSGLITYEVIQAASVLAEKGIGCKVVEIHTLKPIDADLIIEIARQVKAVVTVEEHTVIGGLGSAVAEVLSENAPVLLKRIGVEDCFVESATPDELIDKYGLSAPKIVEAVERFICKIN